MIGFVASGGGWASEHEGFVQRWWGEIDNIAWVGGWAGLCREAEVGP
jgi:hypothetical protein